MSENKRPTKTLLAAAAAGEAMVVDTLGERMRVRWDEQAKATPHGQFVFFAEFLATAGVFDRWVESCPLSYNSPNGSDKHDVLGTLMLGILAGGKRYAQIARVHGDAVGALALGLSGLVREDSVRRALKALDEAAAEQWMGQALIGSVRDALSRPWALDLDATIKPLCGRQEGAQVGQSLGLNSAWYADIRSR